MRTLITNIGELTTNDPRRAAADPTGAADPTAAADPTGTLHDAAMLVEDGRIRWVGTTGDAPAITSGR